MTNNLKTRDGGQSQIVMKSLKEEIAEVLLSKKSASARVKMLVDDLKLTRYEANLLVNDFDTRMGYIPAKRTTGILGGAFRFGVEIECLCPKQSIIDTFTRQNVPFNFEGYNHRDNERYFKFVSDSSIRGIDPIECVSPVLSNKDGFKRLEAACKALNEAGARVNKSTGLHVHVSVENMTDKQYCNVFVNYMFLENVIDSILAPSRRRGADCNEDWCRPLSSKMTKLLECRTISDVYDVYGTRYMAVNPEAYNRHRTIEFRQHQGSTDYIKISLWAKFCAKLVLWSSENRLSAPVASIDDIAFLTADEKRYFKTRKFEFELSNCAA